VSPYAQYPDIHVSYARIRRDAETLSTMSVKVVNLVHPLDGVRTLNFVYFEVSETVKSMLEDSDFEEAMVWHPQHEFQDEQRVISDVHDGFWFHMVSKQIHTLHGDNVFLVPIILYSDGTRLTNNGVEGWPIYVACCTYSKPFRYRQDAMKLVGMVPSLQKRLVKHNNSSLPARSRSILHAALDLCMKEINEQQHKPVEINCGDGKVSVSPLLALLSYAHIRAHTHTYAYIRLHTHTYAYIRTLRTFIIRICVTLLTHTHVFMRI
jgi:hypothetical protein